MSKRKKKMTVKQLRALVAFLVVINIILLICVLVLGIFLAKANSGKARQQMPDTAEAMWELLDSMEATKKMTISGLP